MDSVQASRVDGNPQRWGGQNSPQGDKQRRQAHKLQLLYAALKAGELEQARQAFVALVNVDPSVAHDPYLHKIGAALQSSHVSAAQHFARELEQRGVASWRSMQALQRLIAMLIALDGMLVCTV